jgi:suppressor for copper-sensitivity B
VVGRDRARLRLGFLAGAAGIITSFALLALTMVLIRQAGGQIGWGVQFQNPVFLGVMIGLLGIFALSLVDLVTIPVPRFAASLARPSGPTGRNGLAGDFLAGMLATILATPCSAPFVGTAVTVALTGDTLTLFAIFLAMGVGLASPWLLVALFPGMVALLPRPGAWMIWVRRGLALLLVGTMLWLGTIVSALLLPENREASIDDTARSGAINWAAFAPETVAAHLADGQVVFVDVTANWCITCKANKAFVLDQDPVVSKMAALQQAGSLVPMQADWTRPNEQISTFLASHNRFGIPFNIVYGPAMPDGHLLPELLTSSAVLEALELVTRSPK